MLTDGAGIPLAVSLCAGNRNDVTQPLPLVEAIPAVPGRRGRPRSRPDRLYADRGYDHDKYRRKLRRRGIQPCIYQDRLDQWLPLNPQPSCHSRGSRLPLLPCMIPPLIASQNHEGGHGLR